MSKPNILIDTNALTHLASLAELNGRSVDKWLWDAFNLHTCPAVRAEFKKGNHKAAAPSKAIARRLTENRKNRNQVKTIPPLRFISALETTWLSPRYYTKTLSSADAGERHLMCAAAELVHFGTLGRFIVVTDDSTAVRKFITPLMNDFRLAEVWSSLDLILFMYISRRDVSVTFTKDAVRDIAGASSFSIFEMKEFGESEEERRLALIKKYYRKVDRITELRNIFPA